MKQIRCQIIAWTVAVLAVPILGHAQSETATLTVTVSDSSGQRVPGAIVTIKQTSTGVTRENKSSAEGVAWVPSLPPDLYEVTVKADGFRLFRDPAVHLQVAEPASLSVTLQLGQLLETIDVTTEVSPLNVETAAIGTVVSGEKIEALPLNGRQFIQLALLVPGANPGGRAVQQNVLRQNQIGGLSIAGGRTNNTAFLLDGAVNTDPDYNSLNYSPSIDAIAEFQVQTALFTAEYGRAGGQLNVVTKSGSQAFHGSAFEFARNGVFDARPFNLTTELPPFSRHNFGGTLGGPVVRGRVFFFGAYEQLRRREGAAGLTTVTVPTALERRGDFSQSPANIYDPATSPSNNRQQFPGNKIPDERLNPLALAAINALPLPNAGGSNYVNSDELLQQDIYNASARIDANAGAGSLIFGRWSYARENSIVPDVVRGRDTLNNGRPQNVVAGWTKVLGANKVNELRVAFSQLNWINGLPEPQFSVNGQPTALPRLMANGLAMGGAGAFNGTTGGGLVKVSDRVYQAYDNWSWQRMRHNIKLGGEFRWTEYNRTEVASSLGSYTFTAGYTTRTSGSDGTGNAFASLLLALPQQGSRAIGPSTIAGRQPAFSSFVQDNWRILDRLTLSLGLRYELAPPMHDANGHMASVDYSKVPTPQEIFAQGKLAFYTPTVFVCGQSGYPKGCAYTKKDNIAPRASLAWRLNERTVLRSGVGIYYAANDANPLFRLAAGLPANIAQTKMFNNFTLMVGQAPGFDIFGPAVLGPVQVQQAGIELQQRMSQSTEFTAGAQRELSRNWAMEVSYVGSRVTHLEQNVQPNNAQPGTGGFDPRRPFAALLFAPGTVFPDYVTVQGDRAPVGQINYFPRSARADYNALLTRLERRFAGGLSILSSYTYSKARSNAPQYRNAGGVNGSENSPPQDSFNLQAEWGPAYYDARHRWVTSTTLALPLKFRVSGIYTMQSGFPFTVNVRGDTANVGGGTGGIFVRPNAVPGVNPYLPKSQWNTAQYLNPAAFQLPAAGTFGSVGRNSVVGPGYIDVDLAVSRAFIWKETRRLELRAEAFNLTNQRNYLLVGRILPDPTFGQLLSQSDPRQWQFGARFVF